MEHLAKLLLISVFLISSLPSYCNSFNTPRGIPIEKSGLYLADEFTCLDGKKTIPSLQINDDYCDCADGSDEPGTAACRNGQFYCQNGEYIGAYIASSFVNDGVCDCCDGSDEYATYAAKCNNTCNEKLEKLRIRRKELEEKYTEGHEIYKEMITQIPNKIEDFKKAQKRERELRRIEEEKRKEEERIEELKRKEEEAKSKEEEALNAQKNNEETPEAAKDNTAPKEEVNTEEKQDTKDESSSDYDPVKEAEKQILKEEEQENKIEPENTTEEKEENHEDEEEHGHESDSQAAESTTPPESEEEPQVDYGLQDAFFMLTEVPSSCVSLEAQEYTYQFCPFKECQQVSKEGGSQVSLGHWGKWLKKDDDDGKPPVMIYENGQGCWQGPNRSTKVYLKCGAKNELISASEPSRCEYEFHVTTPAACSRPADEMIRLHHSHDEL